MKLKKLGAHMLMLIWIYIFKDIYICNVIYNYINDKHLFFSVRIIIADTYKALSVFLAHILTHLIFSFG